MERPNMEQIESNFRIFERPSADQSREMADYIYHLEELLSTIVQQSLSGSENKVSSPKLKMCKECGKYPADLPS